MVSADLNADLPLPCDHVDYGDRHSRCTQTPLSKSAGGMVKLPPVYPTRCLQAMPGSVSQQDNSHNSHLKHPACQIG